MEIPSLTTDQMREVDQLMIETYGISLLQMMENAGRALAEFARRMLGGNAAGKVVIVLCGPGNNGGGGMVAARHLHNWGADVRIRLASDPARLKEVPAKQWAILESLGLDRSGADLEPADLVLDALLGYGISGDPRSPVAGLIRWANQQPAPVLALDVPSSLDTTSGTAYDPTIHATATLTLALPKTGLLAPAASQYVGELYLADIGVPTELYQIAFGLHIPPLFGENAIIRV
ncbi:MAG: NAD(P)H-hydrate epimerase [Chloroflexi bacterium]|nr:NAD(P)H-hydrate epimerase [Chloroflexota bacterium]